MFLMRKYDFVTCFHKLAVQSPAAIKTGKMKNKAKKDNVFKPHKLNISPKFILKIDRLSYYKKKRIHLPWDFFQTNSFPNN